MATVEISASMDMHAVNTWYGVVALANSHQIEIINGSLAGIYSGNFSYDENGNVYGTLTGVAEAFNGAVLFNATGLAVSASYAEQLIQSDQIQAFLQYALAENDQFWVAPGADVIDGYGGYNTVVEPNAYSSYSIANSGSAMVVRGTSTKDTLYNVQQINFSDGVYNAQSGIFASYVPVQSHVPSPSVASFSVQDDTTGQSTTAGGVVFASITSDSLNITANVPNAFIVSGTGNDIIAASAGGNNVLDDTGGAVNFEIGGAGKDAFFLDASKNPVSWNTIVNFHAGDFAVIYGVSPQNLAAHAANALGVTGYTGLTLETYQNGGAAFTTFTGHNASELGSSLATAFGTDPSGRSFLLVVGT